MKKLLLLMIGVALAILIIREYRYVKLVDNEVSDHGLDDCLTLAEKFSVAFYHLVRPIAPQWFEKRERRETVAQFAGLCRALDKHGALSKMTDKQVVAYVHSGEV